MWARAVAPVAEWVAQALWGNRKGKGKDQMLPTLLTQRRRTEGRGREFRVIRAPLLQRPKICELCGAEGIQNRYCRSCGVQVSRENMTRAALVGHAMLRTASAKRQASKKLSDHAVANTWWEPSSLPKWLTAEFYKKQIQPQLRSIKAREVAELLAVSHPYAAQIRSGRRLPHQRHWEALAKLAKASPQERMWS
jgi:hypothetical protein